MKTTSTLTKREKNDLLAARERLFELKSIQNEARDEELKIRSFVAEKYATKEEGSETIELDGIKMTITSTINRTISSEEAERMTAEHGVIAATVLTWKPSLKVGELRKHPELEEYIVSKAGPATVVFK
jgi:hypothetical protein